MWGGEPPNVGAGNGTQVSWKNLLLTTEPFFLVPILGNLVGSKLELV